jgi:signal recognition particle subunit SRP19
MRQQDKVIMWPAYFDSARTRDKGRRVPKNFAVPAPRITEMKEAADKLKLTCELVVDAGYSKTPWVKTGMLLVKKKEPKEQTIMKIARQLQKDRTAAAQKPQK